MTERIQLLSNGKCLGYQFFIQAAIFNITGFADWDIKVVYMDRYTQTFLCERLHNPYGK